MKVSFSTAPVKAGFEYSGGSRQSGLMADKVSVNAFLLHQYTV